MFRKKHHSWMKKILVNLLAIYVLSFASVFMNADNSINAESIEVDSPIIKKVISNGGDFSDAMGQDLAVSYFLTNSGRVYVSGIGSLSPGSILNDINVVNGIAGQGVSTTTITGGNAIPIKDETGTSLLSGVKDASISYGVAGFLKENGEIYVLGNSSYGAFGGYASGTISLPKKIGDGKALIGTNDIKNIIVSSYNIFLLTNDGRLYGCGKNNYGQLGIGSVDSDLHNFTEIKVIKNGVKQKVSSVIARSWERLTHLLPKDFSVITALTESGDVFTWGTGKASLPIGDISGKVTRIAYSPTSVKVKTVGGTYTDLTGIDSIAGSNYDRVIAHQKNTNELYLFGYYSDFFPYNPTSAAIQMTYEDGSVVKSDKFSIGTTGAVFLGENEDYYIIKSNKYPRKWDDSSLELPALPFSLSSSDINQVMMSYFNLLVQTKDSNFHLIDIYNNLYLGNLNFMFFELEGKRENNQVYSSGEKYNGEVRLSVINTTEFSNVFLREFINGSWSEPIILDENHWSVNAVEGQRVLKKFKLCLESEEMTSSEFTVDIYRNALVVNGIKNNGKYTQGSSFNLGYNGFAENIVTGKLTKPDTTVVDYTSGTTLNDLGNYTLDVVDQYGNTNSYSFEIVNTVSAESITFTKSSSGNLVYNDAITKPNGIVGSLSLVYPAGQATSTIKTLSIESGHDGANFEVVNTNEIKVIGIQLEAREYTISVSGTDQNDMPFSGDVTFTVDKATQTMAWDDTSISYGTNGLSFGDTATLGVKDLLGTATVSYSLKTPNACVSITDNKVSVTCIPNPASVVFVATPSSDANYDNKPIELPVTISKKAITLQVELQDASTYKNDVTINIGDALPSNRVTSNDSSVDVSKLGNVTYVYKKNGATVANPAISEGVYSVNASYPTGSNADNYTITWQPATLRVEGVTIGADDYANYFTMTTGGNPYTIGTWTKDSIIITPIHNNFSRLDVNDAGTPSTNAYSYEVEGNETVKLTFSTVDGAKLSISVNLKVDKTKPIMESNTYEDADSAVRAILRALTFENYFSKAQNVSFHASDTGSGVDSFVYEITELDASGNELPSTMHSGTATTTDKIALSLNKNYKIKVQAKDMVGNVSDEAIETVYISDAVAQLNVEATNNGVAYDGTTWVHSAVDFKLTSNSTSGVEKYQYSIDGVTFVDFTSSDGTISLPHPLANQKNVTYTFKAINNDGTACDKTFNIKLDKEKPTIQVKGTVEGATYDGSVVDKDVSMVPYQSVGNISGITYYYTTNAASKDSNPLTDSNWKAYGSELKQTTNGTTTYYFKGVSGAKLVSDPVEYKVQIANKAITLQVELNDKGSYSKDVSMKMGDTLPIMRVTCEDAGVDISAFGTPTFTYTKNGVNVDNPAIEEGIYVVTASYPGNTTASSYNITYNTATLRVNGIVLEEDDYKNYFTMTSGGASYTPDTWTKEPIIITPIHDDFNRLDVDDAGSPSTIAYTYQVEGNHNVKLSFYTPEGAKLSVTLPLKYDKTKPVMQANTYVDADSRIRSILRSITFNQYFNKSQKVSFHASDLGSGVASFQYEIIELDSNGVEVSASKTTGTATLTDQITLSINKNYKIKAKAIDVVGNISDEQVETVSLSDQVAQLNVTAKNKGTAYDGTKWVSSAIDFTLKSSSASGVEKYQYSMDGTTFTDFTGSDGTITLPSPVVNQDNVTYTFRTLNNDGSSCDTTYLVKVDMTKPIIEVKGKVNGSDYDGSEVDQEVSITPSQNNTNISGITYYYTTVESAKDANPTSNANWKVFSGSLLHSANGTTTYYVKGVSGAGLISDVVSLQVKIAKKEYTPITVNVTSEGKPYTPNTWAKQEITFQLSGGLKDASQITGYEYTTTSGTRPNSSADWKVVSGTALHTETKNIKGETYWFRVVPVDPNASLSEPQKVQLDVDTPSVPTLSIKEKNNNPMARFINAISFGNWLNKEIEVTMNASDSTSGIAYYLVEENQNGKPIKNTTGKISYGDETNLKIQVKACDKAGNCSAYSSEEQVMIDTQPPLITGVKDQNEYKQYYLPRFVSVSDEGSGVSTANYNTNGITTPILDEAKIKGVGTYIVNAEDHAGNTISLTFKIVSLPNLDDIDGSDESKEIIDQIQKELDENRDKLDEIEIKDTQDWLDDANEKWENLRKKVVEDEDKTSKVEGVGDTTFDPKVELIVDPIEEATLPVLPRRAMYSYDVYLKKGTTVVQPNGSIKVYLPYPDTETPIIYEIDPNGNVKEISAVKEGEYVVFTTTTLMKYAISNTKQEIIDDGKISVPGLDGKLDTDDDVIANPSDKDKPSKNPDGTVSVPPGGSVTYPDGTEIETPEGGILNPDGSLTLPDGTEIGPNGKPKPEDPKDPEEPKDPEKPEDKGEIVVPGPDGKDDTDDDVIAKPNPDGDKSSKNPDGTVTVPPGGSVEYPDGSIIETPDGGILKPDGSLTLPDGTQFDPEGNKKPKVCNIKDTYLNIDTDKDGRPDLNLDLDGNCIADLNIDKDGDNIPDLDIDTDGDEKADLNIDIDQDGKADKMLAKLKYWKPDYNVDGTIAYDTMRSIPKDWMINPNENPDDNANGGQGNSGGSVLGSYTGSITGDVAKTSFWWVLVILNGGYLLYRVKKLGLKMKK